MYKIKIILQTILVKRFYKTLSKSYTRDDSIGHLFRNVINLTYHHNWTKTIIISPSTKLILKSKKTYNLDRIMYKVHIKGSENIGLL